MSARKVALAGALAIGLAIPSLSPAVAQHSHEGASAALQSMSLDQGRKWPTDETLRSGMSQIRAALSEALPRIEKGDFTDRDYGALAETVQGRIDEVVANCKLPEDADLQLHFALAHMLEGVAAMKSGDGQEQGAAAIAEALTAYGDHFDHPGWVPPGQ